MLADRREFIPGSTSDLGESELDTPDLTLVAESILSNELQLRVSRTGSVTCRETSSNTVANLQTSRLESYKKSAKLSSWSSKIFGACDVDEHVCLPLHRQIIQGRRIKNSRLLGTL